MNSTVIDGDFSPPLPPRSGVESPSPPCTLIFENRAPPALPPKPKNNLDDFKRPAFSKVPQLPPKITVSQETDQKAMQNRSNVVRELINNEKLFYKQMSYVLKILSSDQIIAPITTEDLSAIKLNLDVYVGCSEEILKAYDIAVTKAPGNELYHACVGQHLVPILPKFCRVSIDYIKGFDPKIVEHRPQLKKYFESVDELLQKRGDMMATLLDHLFKLFQRPFHLVSILGRLKKCTPESHLDYAYVNRANVAIQKACGDADACKRKDVEYLSTNNFQGDFELVKAGDLEDTRLAYYRKKQKKLALLNDGLYKWIETYSKDFKSLIEYRRRLIKASYGLVKSLDSVQHISGMLDFRFNMINYEIEKFNPERFDASTLYVLSQLKLVSVPLKKLKIPMKGLKGRVKYITQGKKSRPTAMSLLKSYRVDEARVMAVSEGILYRIETVIKNLFLYYLQNVFELLLFGAINSDGIKKRYVSHKGWIHESGVEKSLEENVKTWKERTNSLQGLSSATAVKIGSNNMKFSGFNPSRNSNSNKTTTVIEKVVTDASFAHPLPRVGTAKITFSYADEQTVVHLSPGDIVDVIKWTDGLGNSEWTLIRVGNSSDFFYPSNRLQIIK